MFAWKRRAWILSHIPYWSTTSHSEIALHKTFIYSDKNLISTNLNLVYEVITFSLYGYLFKITPKNIGWSLKDLAVIQVSKYVKMSESIATWDNNSLTTFEQKWWIMAHGDPCRWIHHCTKQYLLMTVSWMFEDFPRTLCCTIWNGNLIMLSLIFCILNLRNLFLKDNI